MSRARVVNNCSIDGENVIVKEYASCARFSGSLSLSSLYLRIPARIPTQPVLVKGHAFEDHLSLVVPVKQRVLVLIELCYPQF